MEKQPSSFRKKLVAPPPEWSQRIVRLRSERGWSQEKLAELVGSDVKSVRRWEKGEATPHLHSRQKLAEVFEVTQIDLGFLQAVPQQQDQRDYLTLQAPERSGDQEQTAETDGSAGPLPGANAVNVTTFTETVISDMPEPGQSDMQSLWQKHAWWLRPLAIALLIVITGICIAWLTYLLIIRPYMQGLEHQQPAFHSTEKLDYFYPVSPLSILPFPAHRYFRGLLHAPEKLSLVGAQDLNISLLIRQNHQLRIAHLIARRVHSWEGLEAPEMRAIAFSPGVNPAIRL